MPTANQAIAVYALTAQGAVTARRLATGLTGTTLFLPRRLARIEAGETPFDRFAPTLTRNFSAYPGQVVVGAAGMVVRILAPLLTDKTRDPAVVVLDPLGRFAISLLSGHLGGANQLARRVAEILEAQAVITTATDAADRPAVEVLAIELGFQLENLSALGRINRMVVEGQPVTIIDADDWFWPTLATWPESFRLLAPPAIPDSPEPLIQVTHHRAAHGPATLLVRPPCLYLGLGCNRGTAIEEITDLLNRAMGHANLARTALAGLASVEAKRNEPALLALADNLGLPITFFPAETLAGIQTPNPSSVVEKHLGVKNVCEAAAMMAAGNGRLIVTKKKSKNATLAVALAGSPSSASGLVTGEA